MMVFAESAVRLAGLAGLAFGWTPELFWGATPAELGALVRALRGDAGGNAGAGAGAGDLARLMEAFPDG